MRNKTCILNCGKREEFQSFIVSCIHRRTKVTVSHDSAFTILFNVDCPIWTSSGIRVL